jgi:hypothetical protein
MPLKELPSYQEQDANPSDESLESGIYDSTLAKKFALEYVKSYGNPLKAYMRTFGVTRQSAFKNVDAYMQNECVRICIAKVTAPTETIASAGEVLAAITSELRTAEDSKDRLKAAEILLKVRGHMDRDKSKKQAGTGAMVLVAMVKQYANKSPAALEAELIGGAHALRDGDRDGVEGEDADGGGEVDLAGEGDFLDTTGDSVASSGHPEGHAQSGQEREEMI